MWCRRVAPASLMLLVFAAAPVLCQQTGDTTSGTAPVVSDRYVLDVAALAREGMARTLSDVLTSQVPGLLVIRGSGLNGAGARIRFAGVRSLVADLPPLVFIDGVRVDAREDDSQVTDGPGPSRLDDVPLDDVQSVEVLRGAATTAIYGPGAAAGVILIRTKAGSSGPIRVHGFADAALRALPSRWPANYGGVDLDHPDTVMQRGGCSLSSHALGVCTQDFVQTFNPLVERNPFATPLQRRVGLSATGGPRWGAFRLSAGLDGDAAAYGVPAVNWHDDHSRWNIRASGAFQPTRNLHVVTSVSRLSSALRLPIYQPVRAALMGPRDSTGFSWTPLFPNPGMQDLDRTFFGLDLDAHPLAALRVHAVFGLDEVDQREHRVIPGSSRTTGEQRLGRQTFKVSASVTNITWGSLRFSTTLGIERQADRARTKLDVVRPDTLTACDGSTVPFSCEQLRVDLRLNSLGIYGMERVAIGDRLVITGVLRRDSFDDRPAWSGTYPTLAVDWIARPTLRFHAAYGSAGQAPPLMFGPFIISPEPIPTPAPIQPERTKGLEVSGEATVGGERWRVHASIYDLRSDVLSGNSQYVGRAVIGNRGMTGSIAGNVIERGGFGWHVNLTVWGNRNRLVDLGVPPFLYSSPTGQGELIGYPANGYWGREIATVSDLNIDGIISFNEVTMGAVRWAGTPYPTQGAAMRSSWRFARRWRVGLTLDYRAGQTLLNQTAQMRCLTARCRERHDPTTPLIDQATAIAAGQLPLAYYEDADYLKLREVAVAFDVPDAWAAALGARAATIMLGGRDLVTWTNYSGGDPETASYGTSVDGTPMIIGDLGTVPAPRTWTLRVRVSY